MNLHTGLWEWDREAVVARTNVSENVVDLLIDKISGLSMDSQAVLMVAAALGGFTFDSIILETVIVEENILALSSFGLKVSGKQRVLPEDEEKQIELSFQETEDRRCRFHVILGSAATDGINVQSLSRPSSTGHFGHDS